MGSRVSRIYDEVSHLSQKVSSVKVKIEVGVNTRRLTLMLTNNTIENACY